MIVFAVVVRFLLHDWVLLLMFFLVLSYVKVRVLFSQLLFINLIVANFTCA